MQWTRTNTLRVLAYLLVVLISVFAVQSALSAQDAALDAAVTGARQAIQVGCEADRDNAIALRTALEGQKEFIRRNQEPPPPTTEQRVAAIDRLIESITIPDCSARVQLVESD